METLADSECGKHSSEILLVLRCERLEGSDETTKSSAVLVGELRCIDKKTRFPKLETQRIRPLEH